jgi:hypothetical protein
VILNSGTGKLFYKGFFLNLTYGTGIFLKNIYSFFLTNLSSRFPKSLGPLGLPGVLLLLKVFVAL